ncbi:MAG: hypothetical protein COT15_02835 [Candidatus Diapherotrites archaeon CG08_land_8_20_14_0_20_34_12]|nr:MAG: hypothetical protein COT15_02835 [Candidatus Diapherotrites archaeon CG08_land_8_20_14_0_20_34_12]
MIYKNVILLAVLIVVALFILGCAEQKPAEKTDAANEKPVVAVADNNTPKEVEVEKPKVEEKKSALPLKFVYLVKNYDQQGKAMNRYVVYYLEKELKCGSRNAIAGIISSYDEEQSPDNSSWAKFTLYLDNGELGTSKSIGKSDLAFDDIKSAKIEYDQLSFMNSLFATAEKKFADSDAWTSDIPTILKDTYYNGAVMGNLLGDFSIMKKGISKAYSKDCTEFTISIKSTNSYSGEMTACVTDNKSEILVPYIVAFKVSGQNMPEYVLQSVEKKSSGVTFYPQCMEPIYCKAPKMLTNEENQTCNTSGMKVDEIKDDEGCIIEQKCVTLIEWSKSMIKQSQGKQCPEPSDAIAEEALKCITGNTEPKKVENDEMGCIKILEC